MCAPISSGGMSIDAPRWIAWRSSASLQSLVQTRSVRREDLEVDARAARRAALDLDGRVPRPELVEEPVHGEGLRVHAGHAVGAAALDVARGSCPT